MSFLSVAKRSIASPISSRRSIVTVSNLSPRVKLATANPEAKTSSLTLVLKAGSRYEPAPGVASVLKNFAFKDNQHARALGTVRTAELLGGVLSSTLTREHLYLTADFLKGDEEAFLQILYQSLFPKLSPHELHEAVTPTCAMETTQVSSHPPTVALELAHRLAFRTTGLGNSLFASADEPVSVTQVKAFFFEATRKNPITLIGTGLNHQKLENIAESFFGRELNHDLTEEESSTKGGEQKSEGFSSKSKYHGGEERRPIDLHLLPQINPTMLISFGSTSTTLSNSSAEALVIPHLLGGVSSVKWAPSSSPLSKSVESIEGSQARAFASTYSDASLLNIEVQAEGSKRLTEAAKKVVEAVKGLAKEKISSEALKAAIAKAKFEVAAASETSSGVVDIAAPMIDAGKIVSLPDLLKSFDSVTSESISKVLTEYVQAKPSVVSIARLNQTGFSDEVGL